MMTLALMWVSSNIMPNVLFPDFCPLFVSFVFNIRWTDFKLIPNEPVLVCAFFWENFSSKFSAVTNDNWITTKTSVVVRPISVSVQQLKARGINKSHTYSCLCIEKFFKWLGLEWNGMKIFCLSLKWFVLIEQFCKECVVLFFETN